MASKTKKFGRPRKFSCPVKLQEQIDQYFSDCETAEKIPTVTGLALFLDTSRKILIETKNYDTPDIYNAINKAKAKIEAAYEQHLLHSSKPVSAIFTLKNNFGWADKREVNQSIDDTIHFQRQIARMTDDELEAFLED